MSKGVGMYGFGENMVAISFPFDNLYPVIIPVEEPAANKVAISSIPFDNLYPVITVGIIQFNNILNLNKTTT